jgi:hypothetical protein
MRRHPFESHGDLFGQRRIRRQVEQLGAQLASKRTARGKLLCCVIPFLRDLIFPEPAPRRSTRSNHRENVISLNFASAQTNAKARKIRVRFNSFAGWVE